LPVSRADASEFRRGAQCASASAANGTGNILQTPDKRYGVAGRHARRAAPGKVSNIPPAISARDVVFQYEPGAPPVIRNLNFSCAPGERLCVVGGNGSGKSTFLKLLCGVLKPQMGKVKRNVPGVGYMPQNVRAYFLSERLEDEIQWGSGGEARVLEETARTLGLSGLMKRHPYDISGGEAQKAVLLAILSRRPGLMILDEPTKGLDPYSKTLFARALRGLAPDAAIVITTHDLEFAAGFATECGMFFDGSLAYRLPPREFFRGNGYYSTAVNRCMQHIDPNAVYYEDVLKIWGIEKPSFTEGLF
ncbi:MAG: energy-coupling factor ABC transporter ATP-binding protein, partial [Firmicutes bacterium]|nr:energy-coupling factor ABC transporter ATP-binding protein [Bacillota bacterium]